MGKMMFFLALDICYRALRNEGNMDSYGPMVGKSGIIILPTQTMHY